MLTWKKRIGPKQGVCIQHHVDGQTRTVSECDKKPGAIRTRIPELKFADDCVLLAHGRSNFDIMVKEFGYVTEEFALKMNMKRYKTTAMRVGRLEAKQPRKNFYCRKQKQYPKEAPLTVRQEGKEVPVHWDNEIKHLGSWISNDETLGVMLTIRKRFTAAMCRMNERKTVWRSRDVTRKAKGELFKSWVIPIFLYGSETWPMQRPTIRREVQKYWNRLIRRVMNFRVRIGSWDRLV